MAAGQFFGVARHQSYLASVISCARNHLDNNSAGSAVYPAK